MAQKYKGQDLLIAASQICLQKGLDLRVVLVGDGRYRRDLELQAARAGITNRVRFAGEVYPAAAVRDELDQADLFVLPSRTEGLPRALVEAMARALPCVGTSVGGVPELLHPEDLVEPGDARALASRMCEVASDDLRLTAMSSRNWLKARAYGETELAGKRKAFYTKLRYCHEVHKRSITPEGVQVSCGLLL
jgi:glycosyltransferase involved in cell wall biosynthesis